MDKGVSAIDVPPPEEEMGRGPIVGPAIRKVRKPLGIHRGLQDAGLPMPWDGGFLFPLQRKKKREQTRVSIIAQDQIGIELPDEPIDFFEIHMLKLHPIPFTRQYERLPTLPGETPRIPNGIEFHHAKVRQLSIVRPDGLGGVRMNLEDSTPFTVNDTPACRKESFFVKVGLGGRNIAVVERNPIFPRPQNPGKLGIVFRVHHLDFHHLDFITAPEFSLADPLVSRRPPSLLEKGKQGENIFFFPLRIESRPKGLFKPVE
jgi:hypothetical protein